MPTTIDQLGSLVWTQTWQVSLLVILVAITTALFARQRPHLAFVLWAVVFIKCVTPPLVVSPVGLFAWGPGPLLVMDSREVADRGSSPTSSAFSTSDCPTDSQLSTGSPLDLTAVDQAILSGQTQSTSINGQVNRDHTEIQGVPRIAAEADASWWSTLVSVVARVLPIGMFSLWLCGVLLILSYAVRQWVNCWLQIQKAARPANAAIISVVRRLEHQLGFRRQIRVIVTRSGHGPMVFGIFRPTIILPEVLVEQRSPEQLIPVLAHEIIHVRRGDTLLSLVQFAAQTIWWFNPCVWWANRQTNRTCERCCDLEVVAALECKPVEYARSLVNIVELGRSFRPVLATSGIRTADVTQRRLRSIMNNKTRFVKGTPVWCWLLAIATMLFVLPSCGVAGPQEVIESADKTASQKANAAWQAQDWKTASEQYQVAVVENPQDGVAWFRLGYALHAQGNLDEAIKAHQKAAEFPQGKPVALYNWACALALQEKSDEALDKLEQAIDAGFKSPTPIEGDADFVSLLQNEQFKKLASRIAKPSVYSQFDFWVGDWKVVDKDGNQLGQNKISKHEDGHLIRESWTGKDGTTGQSINFFDPTNQVWKQTYVGSNGTIYQFTGTSLSKGMSMKGYATLRDGRRVQCHMNLTQEDDGRVKQMIKHSKDSGESWNLVFEGYYVKQHETETETETAK